MKTVIKSKVRPLLVVLATAIALSGCGTTSDKSVSSTAKADKSKNYDLTVGYAQGSGAPLLDIAVKEGYFKDENLNVKTVPFASSADGLNGLQAGKIDVGLSFGTAAPLTFIANGSDFSIIGGHQEGGHPILVQEKDKDKYKTLQDYKGKKVGTIRMFTSDIVFRSALSDAGIDWKKDLQIVEFKTPDQLLEAIISGKVDVAVSAGASYLKAKDAHLAVAAWSNDLNPTHVCCRVVTRKDLLSKDNGEAYKRLLKGLIRAERTKNEQPEQAVEAAKAHLNLDDATINSIVNEPHAHFTADPNSKEVKKMWEQMKSIGYIKGADKININDYINLDIYEQAVQELIKEHPQDTYYKDLLTKFTKQNV